MRNEMRRLNEVDSLPATVPRRSFWEQEEHYQALIETEDLVQPEHEQSYREELTRELQATVAARDKRAGMFLWLQRRVDAIDQEVQRLGKFKKKLTSWIDRMEKHVVYAIQAQGQTDGEWKRLHGNTHIMSLHKNPPRTVIDEVRIVPSKFKTLVIHIPAVEWEAHILLLYSKLKCEDRPLDTDTTIKVLEKITRTEVSVDLRAVKAALEAGEVVPGAHLETENVHLNVE